MKKLLMVLIVFTAVQLNAGDAKIVKELKGRTLIVKVLTENPKIVKEFEMDVARLATYRKNIKMSNAQLKNAVSKYWKHHGTALYKTSHEIAVMKQLELNKKKKLRKSFVVMSLDFYSQKHGTREESAKLTDEQYTGDASYLYLRFWEGIDIVYTSSPHVIPTDADFVYILRYLSNQVEGMKYDKDITELCKENGPQVRTKTLLVTSFQVSKLKKKDLMKIYPYPYKVVSQATITEAILSSDPKYACIVETDQSDTVVLKTMILTGTGQFAGYITSIKRAPLAKKELKNLVQYCK